MLYINNSRAFLRIIRKEEVFLWLHRKHILQYRRHCVTKVIRNFLNTPSIHYMTENDIEHFVDWLNKAKEFLAQENSRKFK